MAKRADHDEEEPVVGDIEPIVLPELRRKPEDGGAKFRNTEELARVRDISERLGRVRQAIRDAEGKVKWLDRLDPVVGLLPVVGDGAMFAASLYVVAKGLEAGLPPMKIVRMLANLGIDTGIGSIPILGDIFDFFFKANKANLRIMERYAKELERKQHGRRRS